MESKIVGDRGQELELDEEKANYLAAAGEDIDNSTWLISEKDREGNWIRKDLVLEFMEKIT